MRTKLIGTSIMFVALGVFTQLPVLAAANGNHLSSINHTVQQLAQQQKQAITNTLKSAVNPVTSSTTERTSITLNGTPFSQPCRIVSGGTTYIPIYYIDKLLQSLGFTATWNGTVHMWTLSNGQSVPSLSINGKTGNTMINVNGSNVEQNIDIIQAKDPASGVVTTFMPIWYVQQILNAMGFGTDTWNGATNPPAWTLATAGATTPPAPPSTSTTTSTPTAANAVSTSTDPTAAQVAQSLLSVYAKRRVWAAQLAASGVLAYGSPGSLSPASTWVGLSLVFPTHPSSQWAFDLGMTNVPQNQPVTAGTLAQWWWNWEMDARFPYQQRKVIESDKYLPDAFVEAQRYSMLYGTDMKNPNVTVTAKDLQTFETNLIEIDRGYRMLNANTLQPLTPVTYNNLTFPGPTKPQNPIYTYGALETMQNTTLTFAHDEVIAQSKGPDFPVNVGDEYNHFLSTTKGTQEEMGWNITKPGQTIILNSMIRGNKNTTGTVFGSGMQTMHIDPTVTQAPAGFFPKNGPYYYVIPCIHSAPAYFVRFNTNGSLMKIATYSYNAYNDGWLGFEQKLTP